MAPSTGVECLGTWDYFGLNHYTTQLIVHSPNNLSVTDYWQDQETIEYQDESWPEYETRIKRRNRLCFEPL